MMNLLRRRPAIPAPPNPKASALVASILEEHGTVIHNKDSGEIQFFFHDENGRLVHLVVRADLY